MDVCTCICLSCRLLHTRLHTGWCPGKRYGVPPCSQPADGHQPRSWHHLDWGLYGQCGQSASLIICVLACLGNTHTFILHQRYLADIMQMSDSFRTLAILLLVHLIHYTVVFYGGQQRQTVSLCLFVKTRKAGPFISAPLSMVLKHLKSLHPVHPGNHAQHHSSHQPQPPPTATS